VGLHDVHDRYGVADALDVVLRDRHGRRLVRGAQTLPRPPSPKICKPTTRAHRRRRDVTNDARPRLAESSSHNARVAATLPSTGCCSHSSSCTPQVVGGTFCCATPVPRPSNPCRSPRATAPTRRRDKCSAAQKGPCGPPRHEPRGVSS
jgi:hypothetical protein